LERVAGIIQGDLDIAALEQRIKDRVRDSVEKNQREYYLREQLKAIHDELSGEAGQRDRGDPAADRRPRHSAEVEDKLIRELGPLERMPSVSAEATVVRTYLDAVLALPWSEQSTDQLDLAQAQAILDADHFGLDQVKDRILDFLSVRSCAATPV
jgi:ATP-dependent Lon protease